MNKPQFSPDFNEINYPFSDAGRAVSRILFDFSVAISCLTDHPNRRLLDIACGSGWTSELLNKMGYDVHAFDAEWTSISQAKDRIVFDSRIDPERLHFSVAEDTTGFADGMFGHVFCYDSLHHMEDYGRVFREMYRVLELGGRAIFVEPGSNHSTSNATREFLRNHPPPNKGWFEKDVRLNEIDALARATGFTALTIKPFMVPSMLSFSYVDWLHIMENPEGQRNIVQELRRFAWEDRVIFHFTKPRPR